MNRIIQYFIAFFLLFCSGNISGQVDSLLNAMKNAQSDTAKLRNLILVTEVCDIPDIELYGNQVIRQVDSLLLLNKYPADDLLFFKSTAINNLGFMHHVYAEYNLAIIQYEHSLQIYQKIKDSLGITRSYNNLAMVYKDAGETQKAIELLDKAYVFATISDDYELNNIILMNYSTIHAQMGDVQKATNYLFRAIKIQDENKDDYGLGHSYNTLASLYNSQEDYEKALSYFIKAAEHNKKAKDIEGLANTYNNLGFIYDMLNNDSSALDYYNLSLENWQKINSMSGVADVYSNLSSFYFEEKDSVLGLDYLAKSIKIRESIGDEVGLTNSYQKLAGIYFSKGNLSEALKFGEKAYQIAKKIDYAEDIQNAAFVLSKVYASKKDYTNAYKMYVEYIEMKESLFNKENQKKIINQQVDYEYSKKFIADSVANAKSLEIAALEKVYQQEQLDIANQRNAGMLIGIALLIGLVIMALIGYRNKRNAEITISHQKEEVEAQKHLIEEKNREVLDSINYAYRIQHAILPPDSLIKTHLPNSFIFYRPKDIVAGDFYWMEELEGKVVFAAADCTGHGVPGALVSVICSNALSKAMLGERIIIPGKLLDRTRELVVQTFAKSSEKVKDGMDISLCLLEGNQLQWAGANNPLWLIRNNTNEITEFTPNKQPVGFVDNPQPFLTHHISLEKGDTIYVFSDGFQDQFGGENGKKLKTVNFKKLLQEHNEKEISEIYTEIETFFDKWKGDFEQLDDVCIIAVRI